MKINRDKVSAVGQFQKSMMSSMDRCYRQALSENIKRGIAKKKLLG